MVNVSYGVHVVSQWGLHELWAAAQSHLLYAGPYHGRRRAVGTP